MLGSAAAKGDPKQDKINAYIEILNTWSPVVFKASDAYAAAVDMKTGPTCKERDLRGPSSFGDSAPSRFAGYAKLTKSAPKLEVDAAVTRMVAALTALIEPTNAASEYYQKRQYKDDDCKRGKELHAVLVENWTAYIAAERELRAFVAAHNDKLSTEALAAAKKKYGPKFRYHFEKLLIESKALVRGADGQTPDVAAIRTQVEAFAATLATATELSEAAKSDKKLRDDLYQGGYVMFLRAADGLPKSVARLIEALESAPSKSRAATLERAHKQVITDYNQLVGAANKTRFSARIK